MKARVPEIFAEHKEPTLEDIDQELDEENGMVRFSKSTIVTV